MLFTDNEKEVLTQAVKEAERLTSGEIRVYVEKKCPGDPLERSAFLFKKMQIHKTEQRNGVLIYLAVQDKKFAVIGDSGINSLAGNHFWDEVKDTMEKHFRNGRFIVGLTEGINMTGETLKRYFPYQSDDINELPDDIIFNN